jgi:predicted ester cyclase
VSSVGDVAKSLVADVFNRGDMDVFDRLFAEDYVNHNMPVPDVPGTKDGFRQVALGARAALPDVEIGGLNGIPPNGAHLEWTEIHWLRMRNGAIVEHWSNIDRLGIMQQLGVITV